MSLETVLVGRRYKLDSQPPQLLTLAVIRCAITVVLLWKGYKDRRRGHNTASQLLQCVVCKMYRVRVLCDSVLCQLRESTRRSQSKSASTMT